MQLLSERPRVRIAPGTPETQKTLRFLGFSFRFSLSPYYYMLGKIPMVQMHKRSNIQSSFYVFIAQEQQFTTFYYIFKNTLNEQCKAADILL